MISIHGNDLKKIFFVGAAMKCIVFKGKRGHTNIWFALASKKIKRLYHITTQIQIQSYNRVW